MRDRRSRGLMRLFRRSARTIRSAVTRLGVRAFKAARRSRRATVVACQRPPRAGAPSRFSVAAMFLMVSRRARSSLMRSTSACSFASRTSLPSAPTTFPNGILPDALRARALHGERGPRARPDQRALVLRERRDDVARQSVLGTVAVAGPLPVPSADSTFPPTRSTSRSTMPETTTSRASAAPPRDRPPRRR